MAVNKFTHTVTSAWVLGAAFCVGVSCWYLLKKRHVDFARKSLKVGAVVGLCASLLTAVAGDESAYLVAQHQPMSLQQWRLCTKEAGEKLLRGWLL